MVLVTRNPVPLFSKTLERSIVKMKSGADWTVAVVAAARIDTAGTASMVNARTKQQSVTAVLNFPANMVRLLVVLKQRIAGSTEIWLGGAVISIFRKSQIFCRCERNMRFRASLVRRTSDGPLGFAYVCFQKERQWRRIWHRDTRLVWLQRHGPFHSERLSQRHIPFSASGNRRR